MRTSCSQGELLWMIDSEKAEIHIRHDIRRRRGFRRRVDTPVATAEHQRQEQGD